MIPIAVLASGRGSNFEAILNALQTRKLNAEIVAVLSDKPEAAVLEKARNAGLKTLVVPAVSVDAASSLLERRQMHDRKVVEALKPYGPRFLVMAGYMRVITNELLEAYRSERGYSRITNVHPSLLPAFPGVHSYAQAYLHGAKVSGVTVHLVEAEVDSGPICAQEAFQIGDCGSAEEVEKRGLAIEHTLYPNTLSWVLPEKFKVETRERRVCVSPS